jgi:xylan 1,4-beta-xylosidase
MKNEIKLFDFKDSMPLSFSILQFDNIFQHMHSYAELVIVLDGSFQINIGKETFYAKEDDLFIINSKVFHSAIAQTKATVLTLLINQKGFGLSDNEINSLLFNLNTMRNGIGKKASEIRFLVFSIIKYNLMENVDSIYTNRAISYSLFAQLINNFSVDISQSEKENQNVDFFNELSSYINDHYKEKLTLGILSEHFKYSLAYLSRLFKQTFHVTFLEYYTTVRVNYSIDDLLSTNKTIEEIAYSNGFDDPRSYVRAFRSVFNGVYPSDYRREHKNQKQSIDFANVSKQYLSLILKKYQDYLSAKDIKTTEKTYKKEAISLKLGENGQSISNVGTKILDIGSCKIMVYSELRDRIVDFQNRVGFKYLVFKDLFNQTLRFYITDPEGNFAFSEAILDSLLGFAKRNYFRPYFKFEYDFRIDKKIFLGAIHFVVNYLKQHLNPNEYQDWMFSISYSGSLQSRTKEEIEDFFDLVSSSYDVLHALSRILIVTPSFLKDDIMKMDGLLDNFTILISEKNLRYDFLSIRYLDEDTSVPYLQSNRYELKEFLEQKLNDITFVKKKHIIMENLNFTNQLNPLNDTVFASSYLAQNMIENIDTLYGMTKYTFFDSYGYEVTKNPFVGKTGLITYNGIKKASYNTYFFFSKLNSTLLKKGNNFLVTYKENQITILLNNYLQYTDYFSGNDFLDGKEDRYICFPDARDLQFDFAFENLKGKYVRVKTSSISRKGGSTYDSSLEIGAFGDMKRDEIGEIQELGHIPFSIRRKEISQSSVNLTFYLEPLETKLIEIDICDL